MAAPTREDYASLACREYAGHAGAPMTAQEVDIGSGAPLPPDGQQEVKDSAEGLVSHNRTQPKRTVNVLKDLWAGMGIEPITEEDIRQARKEMWGNFPRDLPK
jgi:hypothetical protein